MLFKTSKEIAITALMTALLIVVQYVLSAVKGVELVTVFLLCFAFCFGPLKGVVCALSFSLLRCFIFGFFPSVLVLYLIYYPSFALTVGLLGKRFKKSKKEGNLAAYLFAIGVAVLFTMSFTALDNLITALFFEYSYEAAVAYYIASLPTMAIQSVCALISVAVLFYPLTRVFLKIEKNVMR